MITKPDIIDQYIELYMKGLISKESLITKFEINDYSMSYSVKTSSKKIFIWEPIKI